MDQLPVDVLLIIFSKLEVKTILGLRCVCKLWSQIIDGSSYGTYLAEKHLNKAMEEPRILVLNNFYRESEGNIIGWIYQKKEKLLELTRSNLFPELILRPRMYFNLEGSCHGILCFTRSTLGEQRLNPYLLNPLRKQKLVLPAPKSLDRPNVKRWNYGLGFDNLTRRYKVILVYEEENEDCNKNEGLSSNLKIKGEIYTLGTRSQWRKLTKSQPQHTSKRESIFVGGVIYWDDLNALSTGDGRCHNIMAFHMEEEEFRLVSVPFNWHHCPVYKLVDLKGVLSFVDLSFMNHIKIWTLKDCKENWVQMYKFKMRKPEFRTLYCHPAQVIGPWENGQLLLYCFGRFTSYNPDTDTLQDICAPHYIKGPKPEVYSYTASLVSLSWFNHG